DDGGRSWRRLAVSPPAGGWQSGDSVTALMAPRSDSVRAVTHIGTVVVLEPARQTTRTLVSQLRAFGLSSSSLLGSTQGGTIRSADGIVAHLDSMSWTFSRDGSLFFLPNTGRTF